MTAYPAGQLVYMDYGEVPRVVHCRIVLGHIQGHDHMVRTPDGDIYVEVLHESNGDLANFYVGPDDGTLPVGVPAGSVHGFGQMTMQQYQALLAEGRNEVAAEMGRRGIAIAAPVQAAGQVVWVLAEHVKGKKVGDRVNPPPGHPVDGDLGLMQIEDGDGDTKPRLIHRMRVEDVPDWCDSRIAAARATEGAEGNDRYAGDDVRTMEVRYGVSGEWQRGFKESVAEMTQVEFDDFPLEPRTALPYIKAVASIAESAFGQHLNWVAQSRIPEGDRSVHENEVLSRALDLAVTYDCLQVSNLASFELLIRRKQLIAEAHSYNPSAPSYEGADHFMGTSFRPGGAIVVPELSEHVAKKMHQESQILKEKRKAAEYKGKGRGGKPIPTPKADAKGGGAPK